MIRPRLRKCVERWPEALTDEYNPACCRFPKSCSADVYDEDLIDPQDLEASDSTPFPDHDPTCPFQQQPLLSMCKCGTSEYQWRKRYLSE